MREPGLPSAGDLDAVAEEQRIAAATAATRRYLACPIERAHTPCRWQVVDLERSGKIVARTAGKRTAEHIAKELNEKGYVETVP